MGSGNGLISNPSNTKHSVSDGFDKCCRLRTDMCFSYQATMTCGTGKGFNRAALYTVATGTTDEKKNTCCHDLTEGSCSTWASYVDPFAPKRSSGTTNRTIRVSGSAALWMLAMLAMLAMMLE